MYLLSSLFFNNLIDCFKISNLIKSLSDKFKFKYENDLDKVPTNFNKAFSSIESTNVLFLIKLIIFLISFWESLINSE